MRNECLMGRELQVAEEEVLEANGDKGCTTA
jgi:hypothetical protein